MYDEYTVIELAHRKSALSKDRLNVVNTEKKKKGDLQRMNEYVANLETGDLTPRLIFRISFRVSCSSKEATPGRSSNTEAEKAKIIPLTCAMTDIEIKTLLRE
jgi:hypothetical protein